MPQGLPSPQGGDLGGGGAELSPGQGWAGWQPWYPSLTGATVHLQLWAGAQQTRCTRSAVRPAPGPAPTRSTAVPASAPLAASAQKVRALALPRALKMSPEMHQPHPHQAQQCHDLACLEHSAGNLPRGGLFPQWLTSVHSLESFRPPATGCCSLRAWVGDIGMRHMGVTRTGGRGDSAGHSPSKPSPTGMVLDDISKNHTCVPVTQCPCTLNGVVYPPGEVTTAACQTW